MYRYFFKSIMKLNETAAELNKNEIKERLDDIEKEAEEFLQQKMIPRKLIKEILYDVRSLQQDLNELDEDKVIMRIQELDDKGAEVDDAVFFMQSGTGEYLRNAKESAEKKRNKEL